MISDRRVQAAFEYLNESAALIAEARYAKARTENMTKIVRSEIFLRSDGPTVAAKEAESFAAQEYKDAIEAEAAAAREFEFLRAKREAALALLEAWRTQSANTRGAHSAIS